MPGSKGLSSTCAFLKWMKVLDPTPTSFYKRRAGYVIMYKVDLNSDLGESFGRYMIGNDDKIIPLISSAILHAVFMHLIRL